MPSKRYSTKKVPTVLCAKSIGRSFNVTVPAYPVKDDFFPPFKFVVHRPLAYETTEDIVVQAPHGWIVTEVMSGTKINNDIPARINDALDLAFKSLTDMGPTQVGQRIAALMFRER